MANIQLPYRREIDGLRTLAVMPVVLFHAGFDRLSGGFLGVDVFFVISGYLITLIMFREMIEKQFSLKAFYERRARRILPLLYVVTVSSALMAWLWLNPVDLKAFGSSVIATLTFVSNFYFWKTTGYFDAGADNAPMIHTWSLSVEEQFYILFPLVLWALVRFARGYVMVALAVATVILWGAAILLTAKLPDLSFYGSPSRAWELLAGATGAIFVSRYGVKSSNILSLAGMAAILVSYGLVAKGMPHPGLVTGPVVFGTVLVLVCGGPGTWVQRGLSVTPLTLIGQMSYGIYLWHQPVLAFYRLWSLEPYTLWQGVALVAITIGLSWLTWKYVERPFRNRSLMPARTVMTVLAVASVGLIGVGLCFRAVYKDPLWLRPDHMFVLADEGGVCPPVTLSYGGHKISGCQLGAAGAPVKLAFLGDSSVGALNGALDRHAKQAGISVVNLAISGCSQFMRISTPRFTGEDCLSLQKPVLDHVLADKSYDGIILMNYWTTHLERRPFDNGITPPLPPAKTRKVTMDGQVISEDQAAAGYVQAMETTLETLKRSGRPIIVVYPVPEAGWNVPERLHKLHLNGQFTDLITAKARYDARNQPAMAVLDRVTQAPNIYRVYPDRVFCPDGVHCANSAGQVPLYIDGYHLSRQGAEYLTPAILTTAQKATNQKTTKSN